MTYSSKIMGTRYEIVLELEHEQWFVKLKMDNKVEEQLTLSPFTPVALKQTIEDLLSGINLAINPFQMQRIWDDLRKKTQHLFSKADFEAGMDKLVKKPSPVDPATTPAQPATKPPSEPQAAPTDGSRGPSFDLQQRLISEYRNKLSQADKIEVKQISITELERSEDDSVQLQQLIESHQEMQNTLKQMDHRIASLEKLTMKLVEITEVILSSAN